MNPQEIELIQSSWNQVLPIRDTAADLFYNKLFELDPELRALFPEKLAQQKNKVDANAQHGRQWTQRS